MTTTKGFARGGAKRLLVRVAATGLVSVGALAAMATPAHAESINTTRSNIKNSVRQIAEVGTQVRLQLDRLQVGTVVERQLEPYR